MSVFFEWPIFRVIIMHFNNAIKQLDYELEISIAR